MAKNNYNPYNDENETGFNRPGRDPYQIADYFIALLDGEDGGTYAKEELEEMLSNPLTFFAG
jgi:hypothetical protein